MNMIIESIFSLTSRGAVLAGYLEEGTLKVGQNIILKTQKNSISTKVEGIEINRKSISTAEQGQHLAIMIMNIDFKLLSDGVIRTDDGDYIIKNLKIIEGPKDIETIKAPKKWWNVFS